MERWEHFVATLVAALPGVLIGIATLMHTLRTLRTAKSVEHKVNGPVSTLLEAVQTLLDEVAASRDKGNESRLTPPGEDTPKHSE